MGGDAEIIAGCSEDLRIPETYYPDMYIWQWRKDIGKNMKIRVFAVVMMCCMMISLVTIGAQAAQAEPIQPMWDNTSTFTANMSFDESVGLVSVFVYGKSGVTNISLDIKLYYKSTTGSWVEIEKDWNYSANQSYLSVSETFTGVAGREYKIEVSGTVTKSGYAESISDTATAICPKKP